MPDYAGPPEDQALELGPRQPLYAAFYLALLVAWVPTKVRAVASWLSRGPRPPRPPVPVADGRGPVRGIGIPPRRILSLVELELDPAQVAAVTAALVGAIDVGAFSIVQRRADASASESESDSHASGHHSDVHHRYPPIHSLEAGNGRLFLPASDPRRQADRLCRLLWKGRNKHMFNSERRMAQDVIFAISEEEEGGERCGGCEEPWNTIECLVVRPCCA